MTTLNRVTSICILALTICCVSLSAGLTAKQRSKIHPLFRYLLKTSSPASSEVPKGLNRIAAATSSDGIVRYGAIVYTHDVAAIQALGIHINSNLPDFITARLSLSDIVRLSSLESVTFLDPGKIHRPFLDVSVPETGATLLHAGFINNTPYNGSGSIVLIYDTGIDWKHLDFRKAGDTTKTRILFIWDQTLTAKSKEQPPAGFNYGVEYSQAQINGELSGTARGVVREKDTDGHGTMSRALLQAMVRHTSINMSGSLRKPILSW